MQKQVMGYHAMAKPLLHSSQNKRGAQTCWPGLPTKKSATLQQKAAEWRGRGGPTNEALSEAGHWGLDVGMDVRYAVVRGDVSCQSDRFGDENFG